MTIETYQRFLDVILTMPPDVQEALAVFLNGTDQNRNTGRRLRFGVPRYGQGI